MKRALIAAIVALYASTGFADEGVLRISNWSEYIDPAVLDEFEQETGIKVVYESYESGEITETRLLARGSDYDLVVVASEYLGRLIDAGAIEPINQALLKNLDNLWDEVMERVAAFDPGQRYTVPYLWGTTGIGYDAAKIEARMPDAPVDSWAMIFDPEIVSRFADCGVSLVDAPEEVLGAALAYLGRDPNSADPTDINDAQAVVAAIRPYIRTFDSEQLSDLSEGRTCLSLGWSGDIMSAADAASEDVEIVYSVPREGAPVWFDLFVIPAGSQHIEEAHMFLDFMLRPDIIARCSNEVWYANANAASTELVDQELLDDPNIYPTAEVMEKLFALHSRDPVAKRAIARHWTMMKLGT